MASLNSQPAACSMLAFIINASDASKATIALEFQAQPAHELEGGWC
jgi:hypothetical protein